MRHHAAGRLVTATIALASAVVFTLGAVPVGAHAELIDARPLPGSTVGDVDRLEFRFAGDIVEDEETTITLELRRDPNVLVDIGPPEVVITSGYWFVESPPEPWAELVVRGADDDARVTVSGVAGVFELTLEPGDDGAFIDISSLDPDAVSIIRVGYEGIDPSTIEVQLTNAAGEAAQLSAPRPASSRLAADVVGELPEAGDYIVRFNTVAADEGFLQPNGYLFSHDPAAAPPTAFDLTAADGDDSENDLRVWLIGGGAAVLIAAVGIGLLARRRADTISDAT